MYRILDTKECIMHPLIKVIFYETRKVNLHSILLTLTGNEDKLPSRTVSISWSCFHPHSGVNKIGIYKD